MFPNEVRLRDLTYWSEMHVDVDSTIETQDPV